MRKLILVAIFVIAFRNKGECQFDSLPINQKFYDLKQRSDSLQIQVNQLLAGKNKFDFTSMIPWFLTGINVFISAMVYKREVSYKNISFVTESNKMKITDPTLWAFYDIYKQDYNSDVLINQCTFQIKGAEEFDIKSDGHLTINGVGTFFLNGSQLGHSTPQTLNVRQNDKIKVDGVFEISLADGASVNFKGIESRKLEGKIRGYCYFKLNSFELVFNYNRVTGASNTVWEDYMINSIIVSTSFYKIVEKEIHGYLYDKEYRDKLKNFITVADICKTKNPEQINRIIESKNRIILACQSGLIEQPYDFSSLESFLN